MMNSLTGTGKSPHTSGKDLDFDDEARALFERYVLFLPLGPHIHSCVFGWDPTWDLGKLDI